MNNDGDVSGSNSFYFLERSSSDGKVNSIFMRLEVSNNHVNQKIQVIQVKQPILKVEVYGTYYPNNKKSKEL